MTTDRAPAPARVRLLDAAEELFYRHGIATTGVDAVIGRANVAPATLYAHFAGKDALVAAYLQRRYERWTQIWDQALERAGEDPRARLLSVFDALDDLARTRRTDRGCAFLGAAVEITDPHHPAHPWLVADTTLLTGRLRDLAGAAGAEDAYGLAAELLVLYDGVLAARTRGGVTHELLTPPPVRALAATILSRHLPEPG